jgi:uridine kinase
MINVKKHFHQNNYYLNFRIDSSILSVMKKPLVIGIAGGTGSGKTTVTKKILNSLDPAKVVVLRHDYYYKDISAFGGLSPQQINFDHPDALETSLLIKHLFELRSGNRIQVPNYDYTTYKRLDTYTNIDPRGVIIVEGILIFIEKALRELMDIKIFVDTDADERLLRRLKRDLLERGRSIQSVMDQYIATVKPMHLEFVEPSKRWANIIIPEGGENAVAIDMVVVKIREMLM